MTHLQKSMWLALATAMVLTSIGSEFPQQIVLQHVPTVVFLLVFPLLVRRIPLTPLAQTCCFLFLLLHVLGARYIYSYVPYDEWSQRLFDFSITERFGFQRNHYDRLVHFAFGLLAVRPVREILVNVFRVPSRFAFYASVEFVLAFSLLYELFEWGLTLVLSPESASDYNGQQGDPWDAHRDMALALVGSLLALTLWKAAASIHRRTR